MGTLLQDFRYGFRILRQNPAFSLIALAALALGTGATTVMFSVVNTVLLRPLPYPEPGRLFWVTTVWPGFDGMEFLASPEYASWRQQNHVFQNLAGFPHGSGKAYIAGAGAPLEITTTKVSDNFFETLGVPLLLGRGFLREEARPGGPNEIVLSYGLWQRVFGGDSAVAGRAVILDGQSYTVTGVMPAEFQFPERRIDAVTPLPIPPVNSDRRAMATWNAIGRLKPGVTPEEARADMERLFELTRRHYPEMYKSDVRVSVVPLQSHAVRDVRLALLILLAAVAGVLSIACVNVASLLMARATARWRELEIRAALGAGRLRLIRQLLTESLLLSVVGGCAGVGLAIAATRVISRFGPRSVPRIEEVSVDLRVLGFVLLVSLITGLFFGILPAFSAAQVEMHLGSRSPATPGSRLIRRALIAGEIGLSMVLLIGAGLLIESLWRLQNQDLGFHPESVISARISYRGAKIANRAGFCRESIARVEGLPGTVSVAIADSLPPFGGGRLSTFSRLDRPRPEAWHRGDSFTTRRVSPEYFKSLGISLRQGRLFTDLDRAETAGVAIVNEALAKRYFPGENPLGKQIDGLGGMHWKTIVGVVSDSKNHGLDNLPDPEMYSPYEPSANDGSVNLVVRSVQETRLTMTAVQSRLREIDKSLPMTMSTMDDALSEIVSGPRFNAILFAAFAGIALVLAVIGIYGVISHSVAQRTREIGIRMALGAKSTDVMRMIGNEVFSLAGIGLLLGFGGAWATTRYLAKLLYGVKPTDPLTFAAVSATLLATTILASYLPARRAARVDPMVALRTE